MYHISGFSIPQPSFHADDTVLLMPSDRSSTPIDSTVIERNSRYDCSITWSVVNVALIGAGWQPLFSPGHIYMAIVSYALYLSSPQHSQRWTERLCQTFDEHIDHIYKLLKSHDFFSNEITSALNDLRTSHPLPPVEVVSPDIWPRDVVDAVTLLKTTGRTVSAEDEKYLHLLLTHPSGWSATYPDHMDDSWVNFFHIRYPHLNGLVPILDSITYLNELEHLPSGLDPAEPSFFLLATPESFFIYNVTDGEEAFLHAGIPCRKCTWVWRNGDGLNLLMICGKLWSLDNGLNLPTTSPSIIARKTETLGRRDRMESIGGSWRRWNRICISPTVYKDTIGSLESW